VNFDTLTNPIFIIGVVVAIILYFVFSARHRRFK